MKINKVSKLNGTITVPADKSITHRAIMLSSLATGKSYINNYYNKIIQYPIKKSYNSIN